MRVTDFSEQNKNTKSNKRVAPLRATLFSTDGEELQNEMRVLRFISLLIYSFEKVIYMSPLSVSILSSLWPTRESTTFDEPLSVFTFIL